MANRKIFDMANIEQKQKIQASIEKYSNEKYGQYKKLFSKKVNKI